MYADIMNTGRRTITINMRTADTGMSDRLRGAVITRVEYVLDVVAGVQRPRAIHVHCPAVLTWRAGETLYGVHGCVLSHPQIQRLTERAGVRPVLRVLRLYESTIDPIPTPTKPTRRGKRGRKNV